MRDKQQQSKSATIWKYLAFIFTAILISLLFSRSEDFEYQFSKGKPWRYSLLTAPYDFPIYKSQDRLAYERDSITQALIPIYDYNSQTGKDILSELKEDYQNKYKGQISFRTYDYLLQALSEVYKSGIINDDLKVEARRRDNYEVKIHQENNLLMIKLISELYTLKEAYYKIQNELPSNVSKAEFLKIDLTDYLKVNIVYNELLTKRVLKEDLQSLPLSYGVIQIGEKIIDKGDIITDYSYDLLNSLKLSEEKKGENTTSIFDTFSYYLGGMLCLVVFFLIWIVHIQFFMPQYYKRIKVLLLWLLLLFLFVFLTSYVRKVDFLEWYLIPYVMFLILLKTFFDSYAAITSYFILILTSAFFVDEPLDFVLMQSIVAFVGLTALQNYGSRAKLLNASMLICLSYVIIHSALTLFHGGEFDDKFLIVVLYFLGNFVLLMFTYSLAFIIERTFGFVSSVSLIELMDMNSELVKELIEETPGTYQHSTQVSILASAAAEELGANVSLVRAGALYHDIGKIKNASFFTENQGSNNPHNMLPYKESASIIIKHIEDGVKLGQKYKLPNDIIDFIRTHHGKGVTRYFYYKYCNEHPEEDVDPSDFTYPGSNPWTKEQGILMLADGVEAASRSLGEYTEDGLKNIIDKVVDTIVSEGLLNDTPLTFKDIKTVKGVFLEKLQTIYHSRISYPDKKE